MAERRQIILDIQANTGKISQRIDAINLALLKNSERLVELRKEYKRNELSQEEFARATALVKSDTSGLRKELRDLTKQQKLAETATNAAAGSNEQLRAQSALLTKQVNKLGREFGELDEDGKKLEAQLLDINTTLKKNESAVGDNRRNVGNYRQAIEQAIGSLGGFGRGISNVSTLFAGGGVAAIELGIQAVRALTDAVGDAIKTFIDFDQAVATLGAISGATAEELDQLEASAQRLGETTQFSASQVVELQTNFARVGFSTEEIEAATEATLNLALATGETLPEASAVVASTLGGYQLSAEETARVTDVMAASFNGSALNLEKFRESTKAVAPVAAALNIDIETTTAALGSLADAGISGSQAGTGLRRIFSELGSEGSKLSERLGFAVNDSESLQRAFTQLAAEGVSVAEANELVGKLAAPAFLTLVEGSEDVAKLAGEFQNAAGAAEETGKIVSDTASGDIKAFQSATEGVAISLGQRLEPAIRFIVQAGTDLVRFFSGVFFKVWDTLGEILEPIRTAFGELIESFTGVTEGANIAGRAANILKAVFKALIAPVKVAVNIFSTLVSGLADFVNWVQEARQGTSLLGNVINALTFPLRTTLNILGFIADALGNTSAAAAGLKAVWEEVVNFVSARASLLATNLELLAARVEGFFSSGEDIEQRIRQLEAQKSTLSDVGANLGQAYTEAFNAAVEQGRSARAAKEVEESGNESSPASQAAFNTGFNLGKTEEEGRAAGEVAAKEEAAQAPDLSGLAGGFQIDEPDPDAEDPVIEEERERLNELDTLKQQSAERQLRIERDAANAASDIRAAENREAAMANAKAEELKIQQKQATLLATADLADAAIEIVGAETQAGKVLGIASALINTYVAANQALTIPPPVGPILAAQAIITGLANVQKITGTDVSTGGRVPRPSLGFADGGYVSGPGSSTSDSIPAMLSNGESVINARSTAQYWPVLDAINRSGGGRAIRPSGFNIGGVAGSFAASLDNGAFAIEQAAGTAATAQAALLNENITNMPAPIVTVKDISDTQNRVQVKDRVRKL